MKAGRYAISVQWGGGHHYFSSYADSLEELSNNLKKTKPTKLPGRGATPKVLVWVQLDPKSLAPKGAETAA